MADHDVVSRGITCRDDVVHFKRKRIERLRHPTVFAATASAIPDELAEFPIHDAELACRCRSVSRAVRIVDDGLLDALDMAAGGQLAANLGLLYGYVSQRLTLANLRNDEAMLQECADLVQPLRDAWSQIAAQAVAPAPKRVVNG